MSLVRTNLLLIEDEQDIASIVRYALEQHGYQVRHERDGNAGLHAFRTSPPELVVMDLGLPGLAGFDLLNELKRLRRETPVIVLTCRGEEADRVAGLELGADDYVTKPFSPRELVARVRTVLRRVRQDPAQEPVLQRGPLWLDPAAFLVTCGKRPVKLSRPEFRLLECLMRHPERTWTRDQLLDAMHEGATAVTDRTIDAHVKRLREKFAALPAPCDPVETVYGVGYRLRV